MPHIEVLALEITQFRGKGTQPLVPRVLGETAISTTRRLTRRDRRLNQETFLKQFTVAEERNAAAWILDVARKSGAVFECGQRGGGSSEITVHVGNNRSL